MRFILDENVDVRLAATLRRADHDVEIVGVDHPHSIADNEILSLALQSQRILITHDRDFGELIFLGYLEHAGVIFLRLRSEKFLDVEARMMDVLTRFADSLHEFIVVTDHMVRVRTRPES